MLTDLMIQPLSAMPTVYAMKALRLLKQNIQSLLHARKENQVTLAEHCGHTKAWINKFLNEEDAEIQLTDLDKIADFFGIAAYQLFQPGVSGLTERRLTSDRRIGRDRRIGHQGRRLAGLRTELDKLPHPGSSPSTRPTAVPDQIQRILTAAERDIHAFYARGQAADPRVAGADLSPNRRRVRGSGTKKTG